MGDAPQIDNTRPTWRLTCTFETPFGQRGTEVVHVEIDGPAETVAERFLGSSRSFYGEVRVEPVPRFVGRERVREAVTGIDWGLANEAER